MKFSRRRFLQATSAGALITIVPVTSNEAREIGHIEASSWSAAPGRAKYRFDGVAKVTGQKVFARDFHARDMAGWPSTQNIALIVRAKVAGRNIEKLSFEKLSAIPTKIITAVTLKEQKFALPTLFQRGILVDVGEPAAFYGQPIAILIFSDRFAARQCRDYLLWNDDYVLFGKNDVEISDDGHVVGPTDNPTNQKFKLARLTVDGAAFSYAQTDWKLYGKQVDSKIARVQKSIEESNWIAHKDEYTTQGHGPDVHGTRIRAGVV